MKDYNILDKDLDGRLNCFGEFNVSDKICLKSCALNINCVIAKSKFFTYQIIDDLSPVTDKYDGS